MRGHVVEEAGVLRRRKRRVPVRAGRRSRRAARPARRSPSKAAATTAWSMTGGRRVEEPALPQTDVGATRVARGPEEPVVPGVLVLEDEVLAADDEPFEAGAGLGVVGHPGRAVLRARPAARPGGPGIRSRHRPLRPSASRSIQVICAVCAAYGRRLRERSRLRPAPTSPRRRGPDRPGRAAPVHRTARAGRGRSPGPAPRATSGPVTARRRPAGPRPRSGDRAGRSARTGGRRVTARDGTPSRESATRMSPAEHTGKAPSARRALVPSDGRRCGWSRARRRPGCPGPPRRRRCGESRHGAGSRRRPPRRSWRPAAGCAPGSATSRCGTPAGDSDTMAPVLGHPLPEPGVPPRVGVVEPAGDDADGRCAGPARALVGRAVDPQRQAGDDADAGGRQLGAELGRHADAVAGRAPACPPVPPSGPRRARPGRPGRRGSPAPRGSSAEPRRIRRLPRP